MQKEYSRGITWLLHQHSFIYCEDSSYKTILGTFLSEGVHVVKQVSKGAEAGMLFLEPLQHRGPGVFVSPSALSLRTVNSMEVIRLYGQ